MKGLPPAHVPSVYFYHLEAEMGFETWVEARVKGMAST